MSCFRIDSVVRKGVYHIPLAIQCIYRCSDERGENDDGEDGSESSGGKSGECLGSCMQMT